MDGSEHLTVTIVEADDRVLASGELSLVRRGPGDEPGATRGRLRAPLWALSLGSTAHLKLPDGSSRRARIREVTSMDGPVATVNVDLAGPAHRTARSEAATATRSRSRPATA